MSHWTHIYWGLGFDTEVWFDNALVIGSMLVHAGAELRHVDEEAPGVLAVRPGEGKMIRFYSRLMEVKAQLELAG